MPASNLVRTGGGLASAAAGILLLLGHLLDLGGASEHGTVFGGTLVLTAHLVLIFGLMALCGPPKPSGGAVGDLWAGAQRRRYDARVRGGLGRDSRGLWRRGGGRAGGRPARRARPAGGSGVPGRVDTVRRRDDAGGYIPAMGWPAADSGGRGVRVG